MLMFVYIVTNLSWFVYDWTDSSGCVCFAVFHEEGGRSSSRLLNSIDRSPSIVVSLSYVSM